MSSSHLYTSQRILHRKYQKYDYAVNVRIVNDIVFNEKTSMVALFKDYLIVDDLNEFLKQYYSSDDIAFRLPRILDFYDKYSTVFPNYICLEESKYMFKNIERKQRIINEKAQLRRMKLAQENQEFGDPGDSRKTSRPPSSVMFKSHILEFLNDISKVRNNEDGVMSIPDLLENFIEQDSETSLMRWALPDESLLAQNQLDSILYPDSKVLFIKLNLQKF